MGELNSGSITDAVDKVGDIADSVTDAITNISSVGDKISDTISGMMPGGMGLTPNAQYKLIINGFSDELAVRRFDGVERICQPFSFTIEVYSYGRNTDYTNLLNSNATLSMNYLGQSQVRHGIIVGIQRENSGVAGNILTLTLAPRVALLDYEYRSQVYHNLSVKEIIEQVFARHATVLPKGTYRFQLPDASNSKAAALHEPLTYCVQYQESDLAFMHRLMAQWGLGYYFEHQAVGGDLSGDSLLADGVSALSGAIPGNAIVSNAVNVGNAALDAVGMSGLSSGAGDMLGANVSTGIETIVIMGAASNRPLPFKQLSGGIHYEPNRSGISQTGAITHYQQRMQLGTSEVAYSHYNEAQHQRASTHSHSSANMLSPHQQSGGGSALGGMPNLGLGTASLGMASLGNLTSNVSNTSSLSQPKLSYNGVLSFYDALSDSGLNYLTAIAQIARSAQSIVQTGQASHVKLQAGQIINVNGINATEVKDTTWLLHEVRHSGHSSNENTQQTDNQESQSDYQCHFTATPTGLNIYRRPLIDTPQAYPMTATVIGFNASTASGSVDSDEQNRVLVQLPWLGASAQTTAPLRVAQAWAGNGYGAQFLPRVGDEVLVDFLDGNPNRPFVKASLYPYPNQAMPKSGTVQHNGFQSQTPDKQGRSAIWFDDANQNEKLLVQTTGDKVEAIDKNHNATIKGSQQTDITGDQATKVAQNQITTVSQNQTNTISGSQSNTVNQDLSTKVTGRISQKSTGLTVLESVDSIYLTASKNIVLSAAQGITIQVGGSHITLDPSSINSMPVVNMNSGVPAIPAEQVTEKVAESSSDTILQSLSLRTNDKLEAMAEEGGTAYQKGSPKSEEVKAIQKALIALKFSLGTSGADKDGADKDFGNKSTRAIKSFQQKYKPTHKVHKYQNLKVNGIVNKETLLALDEAVVEGWEREFTWHDPLSNMMLCLYSQGGHKLKPWHGSYGETIRDGKISHGGVDLFATVGTDVYAAVDGIIKQWDATGAGRCISIEAENSIGLWENRYENYQPIYSEKGEVLTSGSSFSSSAQLYVVYMHLSERLVKEGVEVKAGQLIGISGVSGIHTKPANPHVHFAIVSSNPRSGMFEYTTNPMVWIAPKYEDSLTKEDTKLQNETKKLRG